jgi:hypothetical protein
MSAIEINDPDAYLEYCETIHSRLAEEKIDWPNEFQKLSEKSDEKTSEEAKLDLTVSASCTSHDAG